MGDTMNLYKCSTKDPRNGEGYELVIMAVDSVSAIESLKEDYFSNGTVDTIKLREANEFDIEVYS